VNTEGKRKVVILGWIAYYNRRPYFNESLISYANGILC